MNSCSNAHATCTHDDDGQLVTCMAERAKRNLNQHPDIYLPPPPHVDLATVQPQEGHNGEGQLQQQERQGRGEGKISSRPTRRSSITITASTRPKNRGSRGEGGGEEGRGVTSLGPLFLHFHFHLFDLIFSFSFFFFSQEKVSSFLFSCISFKYVSLLALVSEFDCFLRSRCFVEVWCPGSVGREGLDWVGPPAWGRAWFN